MNANCLSLKQRQHGFKRSVRPDLLFDNNNKAHHRIVNSARREITKHALNFASFMEERERVMLVDDKLEEAAKKQWVKVSTVSFLTTILFMRL